MAGSVPFLGAAFSALSLDPEGSKDLSPAWSLLLREAKSVCLDVTVQHLVSS